ARAGQFIILRIDECGERIPLTIADYDRAEGTVTVVFMEVGKTSTKLATLQAGDSIETFTGPLGLATEVEDFGTVCCVGGGFGTATIYPIAKAMKEAGNHVISVIGFRTKDLLFWEDKMRSVSDEVIVCTDDGSYGRKGLVTEPVKELCEAGKVKRVVAIGPIPMMKFTSKATEPFAVPTLVSLNPVMVDGTGMCGACRVSVGGATRFVYPENDELPCPGLAGNEGGFNAEEVNARGQVLAM
ncbi:MAG TPA: sulfide/dihydroorotate dehydrogenase-like FAD/NAD-binding protein, partial [Chloroflexota bacterium]|nr:sulfide/dihydroorotate dehydrogenase-like FAD/NAD-binding protein [Chloroflexota bacterium]